MTRTKMVRSIVAFCMVLALVVVGMLQPGLVAVAASSGEITLKGENSTGSEVYWFDASVQHPKDYTKIVGFKIKAKMTKHGNYGAGAQDDTYQCGMVICSKHAHGPSDYEFTYPDEQTPSFDADGDTITAFGVGDAGWLVTMAFSNGISTAEDAKDGDTVTLTYEGSKALFKKGDPIMTVVSYLGDFDYKSVEWIVGDPEPDNELEWNPVESKVYEDVATVSKKKQNGNNYVDIYVPDTGRKSYPVVLWIHGGGYVTGNRKNTLVKSSKEYFLAHGYAFVSCEYTLTEYDSEGNYGKAGMPQMLYDVKAAVRFLRAHAKEYKLNTKFICAMGESAGAGLALMMATSNGDSTMEDKSMGHSKYSSDVQAAISICGPTSYTGIWLWCLPALLGEDATDVTKAAENLELSVKYSPTERVSKDTVPMYLASSKEDQTVPIAMAYELYAKASLVMSQDDLTTAFYEEGGHVSRGTFDTYEAYTRYGEFLDQHKYEYLPKTTSLVGDTFTKNGITYKVTRKIATNRRVKVIGTTKSKGATSITIPDKVWYKDGYYEVDKIAGDVFSGYSNVKRVTIKSTKITKIGSNAFKGINKKAVFYVPQSKLSKYKKLLTSKTGFKKTMTVKGQ